MYYKNNISLIAQFNLCVSAGFSQALIWRLKRTKEGGLLNDGTLTKAYRDFLEATIREKPDNYLRSHRRWKINYTSQFDKKWFDVVEPPEGGDWEE